MLEVSGKFNTAKVFADALEEVSEAQIRLLCDPECVEGCRMSMRARAARLAPL